MSKIKFLSKKELEQLKEIENMPQTCGINHNIKNNENQPEVCSINPNPPQVCSIDRIVGSRINNPKAPQTCSINEHYKREDVNDEVPSQESKIIDKKNFNILDTYGFNVPVSEEERNQLIKEIKTTAPKENKNIYIKVTENGPYILFGDIPIIDEGIKINKKGQSIGWQDKKELKTGKEIFLCRCGQSKTPPFCDGTHLKIDFDGQCTADNTPYDEAAKIYQGCPNAYLMDYEELCAILRFCDPDGSCWNLIKDSKTLEEAVDQTYNCASGRLTVIKDGKKLEPKLNKEIECIYDTERKVLGPLWVKDYIEVKTDKIEYEPRNRVTLCRCGRSFNKPFCDGMHLTCNKLSPEEIEENE